MLVFIARNTNHKFKILDDYATFERNHMCLNIDLMTL